MSRDRTSRADRPPGDGGDRALDSRFTRSDMLKRTGAAGLALYGLGPLLAACGGESDSTASDQAGVGEIKRGGALRVGDPGLGQADTLDPFTSLQGSTNSMRQEAIFDHLFVYDSDFLPQPWLAEEVESSSDLRTWTLRLRRDARWHDGKPVTAEDVAFTIDRILAKDSEAYAKDILGAFLTGADIRRMDRSTIRLELQEGYADVPAAFAEWGTTIVPTSFDPKTVETAPNGSGPFKFGSFTAGRESVFERNDDYWNPDYPFAEELRIVNIPDQTARGNALLSGEIDVMPFVPYSSIATLDGRGVDLLDIPGSIISAICLLPDQAPDSWIANRKIREALALSLDREQIVAVAYAGRATVGNDHPLGPGYPFRPTDIPQRTRDIPRAKALLAEAGMPDGVSGTLIASDVFAGTIDVATAVTAQAKEAGFDIKLRRWPADSFYSEVWKQKSFYVSPWGQRATPELFLAKTAYSDGAWNDAHIFDPKLDELLAAARSTADEEERTQLYDEAMTRIHDGCQWLIPAYASLVHGLASGFAWEAKPPPRATPYLYNVGTAA